MSFFGSGHAVDFIHAFVDFRVGSPGRMPAQGCGHRAVALSLGMDMAQGNCQQNCVVKHVGYIQICIAEGDYEEFVGLVVVFLAIFYDDMVISVDLMGNGVEASVAGNLERTLAMEGTVVEISALDQVEMDLYVGIDYVGVLHILEELCFDFEVLLVLAIAEGCELDIVLREFSHTYRGAPREGHL